MGLDLLKVTPQSTPPTLKDARLADFGSRASIVDQGFSRALSVADSGARVDRTARRDEDSSERTRRASSAQRPAADADSRIRRREAPHNDRTGSSDTATREASAQQPASAGRNDQPEAKAVDTHSQITGIQQRALRMAEAREASAGVQAGGSFDASAPALPGDTPTTAPDAPALSLLGQLRDSPAAGAPTDVVAAQPIADRSSSATGLIGPDTDSLAGLAAPVAVAAVPTPGKAALLSSTSAAPLLTAGESASPQVLAQAALAQADGEQSAFARAVPGLAPQTGGEAGGRKAGAASNSPSGDVTSAAYARPGLMERMARIPVGAGSAALASAAQAGAPAGQGTTAPPVADAQAETVATAVSSAPMAGIAAADAAALPQKSKDTRAQSADGGAIAGQSQSASADGPTNVKTQLPVAAGPQGRAEQSGSSGQNASAHGSAQEGSQEGAESSAQASGQTQSNAQPPKVQPGGTTLAGSIAAPLQQVALPLAEGRPAAGGEALAGDSALRALSDGPASGAAGRARADLAGRADSSSSPAHAQVGMAISRAVRDGKAEFNIKLSPAELGEVSIKMNVAADGRVTALISADNASTMDLLRRDASQLERLLADAGLKADSGSLSFSLQQQGQGGSTFADRGSQADARGREAGAAPGTSEQTAQDGLPTPAAALRPTSSTLYDVTA